MTELFLKIINMSISASWLILAVLALRFVFKKAPKWVNVLLWGIVAVRLICPFSIESALSLIPSAETISPDIMMAVNPTIQTGIPAVNSVVNPVISDAFSPEPVASANPLQIWIPVLAIIGIIGVVALLAYTAISYWRLRRKVDTAVILRDNIFQSENVRSPFVLGIVRPLIYLPYKMSGQDLEHVVAHEQAHIRRRDHWWKPLGFLLLTIHWFNPLMWLAYVLLCRDIELACDEKVIKELGNEQRADYTQALVACSVNRRMIAACPLAFGEVGVKERVKSVMNYKKPEFWIVVAAIIACLVVAVCFLTNPTARREFSMKGHNVTDLEPQRIVAEIAKIEKLDDSSLLCVNADNFDLLLTPSFDWEGSGAVRFFYMEKQQTYSAYLRLFIKDDQYFVTNRTAWVEQNRIFKLQYYLEALKYLPQEQIRQLAPDADGYSVVLVDYGSPGSFDRVITYTSNGVGNMDGWYIHLELQPLHERDGAYSGTGDEVIHLFYGGTGSSEATVWSGKLIPGTTYVSYQCLYMNPLSSYFAFGGDSGCKYIIGDDFFATVNRDSADIVITETHPKVDYGAGGVTNSIDVSKWEWQDFPYTDEQWASLYKPGGSGIENISECYNEMLYQPLEAGKFLLRMDGDLWLVELKSNEQMGTYLWSIYSLVPESVMGVAQWEYAPMLSSRDPYFRFEFNMEHTQISATCTQSPLVDFDAPGTPSDTGLTFQEGNALYWSPIDENGNVVTAATIYFTIHLDDATPYHGTIYIDGNSGSDGRRIYTASLVGAGLHLDPNNETEGGVISGIVSPNVIRVVEHDLTTGDLEVPVEDLTNYVFYTNSMQISVTVKGGDFEGQVNLLDVSQNNAQILQANVSTRDDDCLFTGLTSARLYRIDCEGLDGCTVFISGDK